MEETREAELRGKIHRMMSMAQVLRVNQVQMASELKGWPKEALANCDLAWKELNVIDRGAERP